MLQKGQTLNQRYQIQSVLGKGGFGAVYKAWDISLQKNCAVKENLVVHLEAQKQFRREAVMLANLNHKNLVRVTDYFIVQDQGEYLVMDYVEGDDLHTIMSRHGKPLPVDQSLNWINQVCDALIYIHSQNPPIIHRDIKPANIRITPQGDVVLVDFGLAKVFKKSINTTIGARGLTPHFAAPEQYSMGGTDAQSDIYSLGVTLYCMLTYQLPPDGIEILVGNSNAPPLAKFINPNVPNSISEVLQRAMQVRRTERYKSVNDFKNDIGPALGKREHLSQLDFKQRIRVLIVDDIDVTREYYVKFLRSDLDMLVVGEADNGKDAIAMFDLLKPDIVLMDTHMPILDGITATEEIVRKHPDANIIICTVHDNPALVRRAKLIGVKEYLIKPFDQTTLLSAIRRAVNS